MIKGKLVDTTDEKWKEIEDNVVANLHLAMVDSILSSIIGKKRQQMRYEAL